MILSIDPHWGKPWAFAVFTGTGEFFSAGKEEHLSVYTIGWAYRFVITEEPYLQPVKRGQKAVRATGYNAASRGAVHSFRTLCYAVGQVQQFAADIGAEVHLVRPVDWKRFYRLDKRTDPELRRQIREQLTGIAEDEDLQDAVLIGRYWIEHVREVKP